jgi:hypothetical protein
MVKRDIFDFLGSFSFSLGIVNLKKAGNPGKAGAGNP